MECGSALPLLRCEPRRKTRKRRRAAALQERPDASCGDWSRASTVIL